VRWDDGAIHWRAESDKKRVEWLVPVPQSVLDELRAFQRTIGSVGGFVFAKPNEPDKPEEPLSRHELASMLRKAEEHARLPKLEGSLWHAYRRLWATERKHLPVADVAAAGGWRGPSTLLTCYQQATPDAMRIVMTGTSARNG
jgi:integrase